MPFADRERFVGFLVAVDDRERDLLELGVPDPLADGVVAVVELDPVAGLAQLCRQRSGHLSVIGPSLHDPDLHRREPERELAAEVLDQDPDEPLQ
jgi:hypothetical protein